MGLTGPASSGTIRRIGQQLPPPPFGHHPLLQLFLPPRLVPARLAGRSRVPRTSTAGMDDPVQRGLFTPGIGVGAGVGGDGPTTFGTGLQGRVYPGVGMRGGRGSGTGGRTDGVARSTSAGRDLQV